MLVFDGDCAFCTTWVDRLRGRLPVFPEAQPWQWLDVGELGLSATDVRDSAWLVTAEARHGGHRAFTRLLIAQPRAGLRFAGHLLETPPFSWIAALGYRVIARYRHALPGGTPACAAPRWPAP